MTVSPLYGRATPVALAVIQGRGWGKLRRLSGGTGDGDAFKR